MSLFKSGGFLLAVTSILVVTGCVANKYNTSIIPLDGGGYDMVSTAETEDIAYKNAERSAKKECKKMDKQFFAVSHKSVYQGVDKEEKQNVAVTNVAMAWITGTSNKEDRSDDYKVTMKFDCR